jgi:hypothetical protein
MSRRSVAWLLTLPLAVIGAQLAHEVAYRLVESGAHERAHLLADTGHGYLRLTAAGLGVLVAAIFFSLVLEVRSLGRDAAPQRPRLWAFAAFVPATFIFQEHAERLLHDGAFPWGAALEPTFLVGIVLQLPFAVLAYAVARLLLGVARALAALLRRAEPPRLPARAAIRRAAHDVPVSSFLGFARRTRAPPTPELA